jgi:hypothetical protein
MVVNKNKSTLPAQSQSTNRNQMMQRFHFFLQAAYMMKIFEFHDEEEI